MAQNPKQQKTIHGIEVTQMQLQGKWYTPVDQRVKIAQMADPGLVRRDKGGYKVIDVQFVQLGDKWAYFCMVEYPIGSGITVPGSDFIDLKDPSGVAKAETSAIGRALGLHGIASEESIASAEEARRATAGSDEDERPAESARPAQAQRPAGEQARSDEDEPPANEQQLTSIRKLCAALGREEPAPNVLTFTGAGALIRQLSKEYNTRRRAS